MGKRRDGGREGQSRLGEPGIQSCAALLVVRESDLVIVQASENAPLFLGTADAVIGWTLDALGGDVAACIRANLGQALQGLPLALRCRLGSAQRECDLLLHRPTSGGLAIELEPAGSAVDLSARLQAALQPILSAGELGRLCDASARVFQELTGYDRVLIFRFDPDGQGEVIAEQRKPGIASCLGQRFGDSELPPKAHLMIERHWIRHLVDADERPVAVRPRRSPITDREIDLSGSTWRGMSRLHLQFLKRMGVRGTLVASLLVGGRPWGLVVCHHRTPRFLHYPVRAACELLAEAVATRIVALEAAMQVEAEHRVRGLEARLIEAIARHGDWVPAVLEDPSVLLRPIAATGAVLVYEGRLMKVGATPGEACLGEILAWLDAEPRCGVIATAALGERAANGERVLAAPLSTGGGEYLIWFRAETADKDAVTAEASGQNALPAQPSVSMGQGAWGRWSPPCSRSLPWSVADRLAAGLISTSVSDVIHQFRSVRVLIAQAQLAQARAKAHLSDQPILIADASGTVLLTTPAWDRLPSLKDRCLERLHDLIPLCAEPLLVERHLGELIGRLYAWRGHIGFCANGDVPERYLVRADPVLSSPGHALGFVVILIDCRSQMTVREAAQRIQDSVLGPASSDRLMETRAEAVDYAGVMSAVAGNVHRTAQQLTDAADADLGVALATGVETSCARTFELLERLIAYSGKAAGGGADPLS
ncbi:hypothetical protein CKO23_05370 [Thiocystis violacea]|nr:GAF domain-containing protein [Thiocystis violacea]MBK1721684.1 hypothetical protein [Thiocystis violacea]